MLIFYFCNEVKVFTGWFYKSVNASSTENVAMATFKACNKLKRTLSVHTAIKTVL